MRVTRFGALLVKKVGVEGDVVAPLAPHSQKSAVRVPGERDPLQKIWNCTPANTALPPSSQSGREDKPMATLVEAVRGAIGHHHWYLSCDCLSHQVWYVREASCHALP